MVFEILHRVVQILAEYFEDCSDATIKENLPLTIEVSPTYSMKLLTWGASSSEVNGYLIHEASRMERSGNGALS